MASPSPGSGPVPPGGTIGILGGGQLGRMLAMAGARLGLRSHIFAPESGAPARHVAAAFTQADYRDVEALKRFAESVDVVTYEFENVPAETARVLAGLCAVRPGPRALAIAQDRLLEKTFLNQNAIDTAPFAEVSAPSGFEAALAVTRTPAILKTRRGGYDGKGQKLIRQPAQLSDAWTELGAGPMVLEAFVNFEKEISIVAARALDGTIACFDVVENRHENHILRTTIAPARMPQDARTHAIAIAQRILTALDYVGVIGIEMFFGPQDRIRVNEFAPRVHNSGHWTLDACHVSQFEQHMRAVAGWPLGNPERHSDAVMTNILGGEIDAWMDQASSGEALHLYDKGEGRPGRKMGHHTALFPKGSRR